MEEKLEKFKSHAWDLISVNDSERWLLKFSCQKLEYQIILTDLTNVFIEVVDDLIIHDRCKELNNRLEAPTENVVNHIELTLLQRHNVKFTCIQAIASVCLSFSNSLESGIPFRWKFICEKQSDSLNRKMLLDPMILTVTRLLCENDKLKETIKKKDDEIKDYRDSGYKVSRPHLKTDIFDQSTFDTQINQSKDYAESLTEDYINIVKSKRLNELLIKVSTDSCSSQISHLARSPFGIRDGLPVQSVLISHSPPKKGRIRKVRPAVRGCVLDASDDVGDASVLQRKFVDDVKTKPVDSSSTAKQSRKIRKKPLF